MKTDLLDIRHCDCMDLMRGYPDKHFDLAIVDPPYGINADKKNSTAKLQSTKSSALSKDYGNQQWDSRVPDRLYFDELIRVSKNQIIWGVNYFSHKLLAGGRIYWDKQVTMPTYSDGEIAYCSMINSVRSFVYAWHGMIQGDMKHKESRIHPTQKPVPLYRWLLANYAKEGDTILDTHLGSGSIAIACHYAGYHLTACELDADYYKAACERIKRETAQLTML